MSVGPPLVARRSKKKPLLTVQIPNHVKPRFCQQDKRKEGTAVSAILTCFHAFNNQRTYRVSVNLDPWKFQIGESPMECFYCAIDCFIGICFFVSCGWKTNIKLGLRFKRGIKYRYLGVVMSLKHLRRASKTNLKHTWISAFYSINIFSSTATD